MGKIKLREFEPDRDFDYTRYVKTLVLVKQLVHQKILMFLKS